MDFLQCVFSIGLESDWFPIPACVCSIELKKLGGHNYHTYAGQVSQL